MENTKRYYNLRDEEQMKIDYHIEGPSFMITVKDGSHHTYSLVILQPGRMIVVPTKEAMFSMEYLPQRLEIYASEKKFQLKNAEITIQF